MNDVDDLCASIRDLINDNKPVYLKLLSKRAHRNQVWACLDVIEDADLAIESYFSKPFPKDDGSKYLLVYGLLQSMIISLEAAFEFLSIIDCKAAVTELKLREAEAFDAINQIRIAVAGHPSNHTRRKDGPAFHAISRISIEKNGFDMLTSFGKDGKKDEFTRVDLPPIRKSHQILMTKALEAVRSKLESWLAQHKHSFSGSRLINIVGRVEAKLGYVLGLLGSTRDIDVPVSTQKLLEHLAEFESRLTERSESGEYSAYEIVSLRNALERLKAYGEGDRSVIRNELDQRTFAFFVQKNWPELEEIASSIDQEYDAAQ